MTHARLALIALAALTGCERVPLLAEVHPSALVDLVVDGRPRGALVVERERQALLELLPADLRAAQATWLGIEGRSGDGRRLSIGDPAGRYKDHVAYLSKTGAEVSLGWWVEHAGGRRRARPGPRLELRGLEVIEVITVPRHSETPSLAVSIDGGRPRAVGGGALDQLATVVGGPARDGQGEGQRSQRQRGWRLVDVVALAAPTDGVAEVAVVAGAERRTIAREALIAAGGSNTLLKRNARGELVFRDYADEKPAALRGVARLEIRLRR